jgi:AcrR family transcriptional regulator
VTTGPTSQNEERPRRKDAQRNRDALLCAGRSTFAAEGLDAPLEGIARRAGVAIGTLYRHFPTRLDLVEAIFTEKLQAWIDAGEAALATLVPWDGFAYFLERVCELQAHDRGFGDLTSVRLPDSGSMERARARMYELSCRLVERAQQDGSLRPDVTPEDLAFLIWAHTRITDATHAIAPRAWRRQLALMLDGLRAPAANPLPEPPLEPRQVYQAMVNLGARGACG